MPMQPYIFLTKILFSKKILQNKTKSASGA